MKSHITVLSVVMFITILLSAIISTGLPPVTMAIATGIVAIMSLFKKQLLSSSGNLIENTSKYANYIFYGVNGFYILWMGLGIFYNSHLIPEIWMTKISSIYLVVNILLRQYFQDAIVVADTAGQRNP